jgi:acyl-coenzyme A thioesterase PaaI-like protein
MSAAIHTALPAGKGYLTLDIKINFQRPVFSATGEIMAEGKVVWISDPVEMSGDGTPIVNQVATAEGRIIDSRGLVHASGTCTCMIYDAGSPPPGPSQLTSF